MRGRLVPLLLLAVIAVMVLPGALVHSAAAITYAAGSSPSYTQEVNGGVTLQLNVTGAQTFTTYTFTWRVTDPTGTVTTSSRSTGSFFGTFTQSVVFPRDFSAGANTNYVGNYTVRIDQTAPSAQTAVANTRFEIGLLPSKTLARTFQIIVKAQGYLNGENVSVDVQHAGSSLLGFPSYVIANTTQGIVSLGWRPSASTPLGTNTVILRGSSTLKIPGDTQLFSIIATNLTISGLQIVPPLLERTQSFEVRFSGTYASGTSVRSGTALVRVVESDGMTTHFVPVAYDNALGLFRGSYRVSLVGFTGTWVAYVDVNSTDDGYGNVGPLAPSSSQVSVQTAFLTVSPSSLAQSYTAGDTVYFSASVSNPDGTAFSSGTVTGTFTDKGVQVGSVLTLAYVPSQGYWTGSYTVDSHDPVGSWVLMVDASDAYGNHGQATASTTVNAQSIGPAPSSSLTSLPLFLFIVFAGLAGSVAGGAYLLKGRGVGTAGTGAASLDTLFQMMGGEIPAKSTLLILAEKDEEATGLALQLAGRYLEHGGYCGFLAYGLSLSSLQGRMRRSGFKPKSYLENGLLDLLDCNSGDLEAGAVKNVLDIVEVGVRVGTMLEKGSGSTQRVVIIDSLTNVAKSFPVRKVLGFLSFLGEKVKNEKGVLVIPFAKEGLSPDLLAGLEGLADGIVELGGVPGRKTLSVHKTFGRQVKPMPVEYQERKPPGMIWRLKMFLNLD